MPLFRRANAFLLVAVLCVTARAGVVAPVTTGAPVFAPPVGAWSSPLTAAFADPTLSPLLPPSLSGMSLGTPDALRVTAPLVLSLEKNLSVTPQALAAMDPAQRHAALELAADDAKETVRAKVYELAEKARAATAPGKAMDKHGRAELYAAVSELMELRQFYGAWIEDDPTASAALENSYKLVTARAWEVRTFLLQRDDAPVSAKPEKAAEPAAPLYVLEPSGTAAKIRADMANNKSGWGQNDFDTLYAGYGFVLRQGGKHRFYSHPHFPQLTASVSRQNDLPPGYAQTALKDIAELERLVAAQHASAAAPETGPPATLNLADLSILLSQPKPKPEKTRPVAAPAPRPVPARLAVKTAPAAPAPPKIAAQLAPSTPKVAEPAPEPPPVKTSPEKPASLIERIRLAFTRKTGGSN